MSAIDGFRWHAGRGFSLIELLVVMAIIAVLAAALVLAVGASGERRLAGAAEQFEALIGEACSEAELGGRDVGLLIEADGYAFARLDGAAWRRPDRDGVLRARHWPHGLRANFSRDGLPLEPTPEDHETPQLVCFSSGQLTPFVLTLAIDGGSLRYRLRADEDALIRVEVD